VNRPSGPDIQRAIEFLSTAALADSAEDSLPDRPDYDFLARRASGLGHDVTTGAVKEAFRRIMSARLVASRKPWSGGGGR
jgi:hypothetical protein